MKNKRLIISIVAGIMAAIMVLSLLLQLIPIDASAATSDEIQDQIDELEKDQDALQDELKQLESQRKDNVSALEDIVEQKSIVDQQVALLFDQIDNMNDQIAAYAVMIADKQAELDKATENLENLRQKYKERLRTMEEEGSLSYWSVLFQATSFIDLLDRFNMIQEIAAADRKRIEEMDKAAAQVAEVQKVLQQEKASLQDRRYALNAKQKELEMKSAESEELMAQLIAKGEEFDKWMAEKEDELAILEDKLVNMEAEYDRVKFEEWLATSVPPTTAATTGSVATPTVPVGNSTVIYRSGTAMTPNTVDGVTWYTPCDYNRISSTFGMRLHPIENIWKMHKGIDYAIGHTPIYATRAGVVTVATTWEDPSAGYYVVIDHGDGFKSIYMHMCRPAKVKKGDFVLAGQELGCVGSTGASTGNHLHFGISKKNSKTGVYEYVNPLLYVI